MKFLVLYLNWAEKQPGKITSNPITGPVLGLEKRRRILMYYHPFTNILGAIGGKCLEMKKVKANYDKATKALFADVINGI